LCLCSNKHTGIRRANGDRQLASTGGQYVIDKGVAGWLAAWPSYATLILEEISMINMRKLRLPCDTGLPGAMGACRTGGARGGKDHSISLLATKNQNTGLNATQTHLVIGTRISDNWSGRRPKMAGGAPTRAGRSHRRSHGANAFHPGQHACNVGGWGDPQLLTQLRRGTPGRRAGGYVSASHCGAEHDRRGQQRSALQNIIGGDAHSGGGSTTTSPTPREADGNSSQ